MYKAAQKGKRERGAGRESLLGNKTQKELSLGKKKKGL